MVSQVRDLPWFRVLTLVALMTTIAMTWPLWDARSTPPLLPILALPSFSLGVPLIVCCAATFFWPLPGAITVSALVVYGMLSDQTRMQPEFFSLPLLIWGTLPLPGAQLAARISLVSLWFYSGLGKVFSPRFVTDLGPRTIEGIWPGNPEAALGLLAMSAAVAEITLALLAIWPRTRRIAAWSALIVHAGILLTLATHVAARNEAVWPWNVALAFSGFAFIAPWRSAVLADWHAVSLPARVVSGALALLPLGFYFGVIDAYPAHQLYSGGTARATVYCPRGCRPEQDINATWLTMNVPLPPQPRLYLAMFAQTCGPGDMLRIEDPHPPPWGSASEFIACPAGSLPMAHP